jgi:toxin FitB
LIGHELLTTFVSAGELERWTIQRQLGARRKAEIDRWISGPLLTGGRDVARKWGEIVAYADKRGRPRPVNESSIAACCLTYELPLATLNRGHFDDFVEFEGLRLLLP